jgi:(R)-2-hydroxyacyl-CoA dehydratese activating ATPase
MSGGRTGGPLRGPFHAGLDVGSSYAKAVLLDGTGAVVATAVRRTGIAFGAVAEDLRADLLLQAPEAVAGVARTVATGYGRTNVAFADAAVTEVTCQAVAAWHLLGEPVTVIDVGGQDTKVIEVGEGGRRLSFQMNRKCASGTGAFLEEMAARLDTVPEGLEALASRASEAVPLSSFCTVFAKSELLSLARAGKRPEDIALGVYDAVVKRIVEMARPRGGLMLTGGAARPGGVLVARLEAALGRPVHVPGQPQLTGALGAALVARRGDVPTAGPAGGEG